MSDENVLEKTTRINLLLDFYSPLLTEKQRTFLSCYYHDDLSLGEIASEFDISRQAVYEHIKRAQSVLEDYEDKLGLLTKHEERTRCVTRLKAFARRTQEIGNAGNGNPEQGIGKKLEELIRELEKIDE